MLFSFTPEKNKGISAKKLYKTVVNNYIDYEIINLKGNVKLNYGDKNYNLKANIRIKHDSIIWINLNHSTGISVARIILTNDSIKVLDRINKVYYSGDYLSLTKKYRLDFSFKTFQSIFTNEFFDFTKVKKKEEKVFEDFKSFVDSNFYKIQNFTPKKLKKQIKKNNTDNFLKEQFYILPENYKIKEIKIEDINESRKLHINYSEFTSVNNQNDTTQLLPKKIEVMVKNDKQSSDFTISYNKIRINQETKFSFKIPDSYKKEKL
jgi:hypothetical protein